MNFGISTKARVIFSCGASGSTGEEVKKSGCKKVLLIHGQGIKRSGIADKVLGSLKAAGLETFSYEGVKADAPDYIVEEAAAIGRRENVDAVIGLGGGSAMDVAKGVNVLLSNPSPLAQYCDLNVPQKLGKYLVLIPTTSGTGSEVSNGAIFSITSEGRKIGICGPNATANLAIIDPELCVGVPARLTAATGMDTIAHAIGSITGAINRNPLTDLLAADALRVAFKYLPAAVKDGKDIEAREKMCYACMAAGMAFNDNPPHLDHSIAHAIGAVCHVHHGEACGIALPVVINYIADAAADKLKIVAEAVGVQFDENTSNKDLAAETANAVLKLYRSLGLPSMKQLGILEIDLPKIAEVATLDLCRWLCPRLPATEDIYLLLQQAYNN